MKGEPPWAKKLRKQHEQYKKDPKAWHQKKIDKETAQAKKQTRSVIKKPTIKTPRAEKPAKPLEEEGCCAFAAVYWVIGWMRVVATLKEKGHYDIAESIQKNPHKLNKPWIELLRNNDKICKPRLQQGNKIDYGADERDMLNMLWWHNATITRIITETTVAVGHKKLKTTGNISKIGLEHNPLLNRKHKNFLLQDVKYRRHPDSPTQYYIVITPTHALAMSTTGTEPTQLTFYDQRGAFAPELVKSQPIEHLWRIEFPTT